MSKFNYLDPKRMALFSMKNSYYSGEVIKQYKYCHSILTGTCFAFFIGLFSAGPSDVAGSAYLWVSTLFFSVGLMLNFGFALFYFMSDGDLTGEDCYKIHNYSITVGVLILAAILFPLIAFVSLVFYYSVSIGLISLILGGYVIYRACKRIPSEIRDSQKKMEKTRSDLLEAGRFAEYEEFQRLYDFPVFTIEEGKSRAIEFALCEKLLFLLDCYDVGADVNDDKNKKILFKQEITDILIRFAELNEPSTTLLDNMMRLIKLINDDNDITKIIDEIRSSVEKLSPKIH